MTNDMPESPSPAPAPLRRIPYVIGAVVIGAVIGFAGVYGLGGLKRNAPGDSACAPAVNLARKISPLAHGEVAALTMATAPLKLPDLAFDDADGKPKKLSDWRGKTVLVNLWATWCGPCVVEMPSLDALAARSGQALEIVAISQDLDGRQRVGAFFAEHRFQRLEPYLDPRMQLMPALGLDTLPTTILYDGQGREVWRMTGMAEWGDRRTTRLLAEADAG
jgi:thiol-disulfide isomerase/thioredoxin